MYSTIYTDVGGVPFKIGDIVVICCGADETIDESKIGQRGVVKGFEYETGVGQTYPHDPMIVVQLDDGTIATFWNEEMKLVE